MLSPRRRSCSGEMRRLRDVAEIGQRLPERARHRDEQRPEQQARQQSGQETRTHGAMINRLRGQFLTCRPCESGSTRSQHESSLISTRRRRRTWSTSGAKDETQRIARAAGRIRMRPATLRTIAAGRAEKGRRARHRAHRRDTGGEAHLRADPAVPSARAHPRRRRVHARPQGERGRVRRDRGNRRAAPASKWRRSPRSPSGLLTIYDMCKAVDRGMRCERIRLLEKQGGKSGHWRGARAR